MTDPLFLLDRLDDRIGPGQSVSLRGDEGRHAAVVRRIRVGEIVILGDGQGRAVRARVSGVAKSGLDAQVVELLAVAEPARRFVVAQALAKGERAELAVELLTEVGVAEIVPWQAARSVVRWNAERADRGGARWRATAREATKQSRRLWVPEVAPVAGTEELLAMVRASDLALVLHESADDWLSDVELPERGSVLLVVGPEGGIAPEELDALAEAGAVAVRISDGVLRTSTAGVVAVAGLMAR